MIEVNAKDRDEIYFVEFVRVHKHPGTAFGIAKYLVSTPRTGMKFTLSNL